ncbi:MAG: NAD(P)/FAD-dependent oxidoreductase [Phototrophicaceae bacterium]|jgi:NADH dehydrogenase
MTTSPTRVVIIGAGYTGIWAYKFLKARLGRKLTAGEVAVTVIASKNYHSFHGWTAESITGIISIPNRQSPVRPIYTGQTFLQATVVGVNLDQKTVSAQILSSQRVEEVPFDYLLLANGSYDNMESVPGLHDYGYTVKAHGGVATTRNQLIRVLEVGNALPAGEEQDQWMTVVVGGGGIAGVEFSANIAEMYQAYKKFYPILQRRKPRIVLIHSGAELLPVLRPKFNRLADYCTRALADYGVEVILNTRISQVTAQGAQLSNGQFIPSKTVLSTVGQRLTVLPGTEAFERTPKGQILTDEFLHVKGQSHVWASGDTAYVMRINGEVAPTNALWAIMEGKWAGENIAYTILGKQLKPFSYPGLGQVASVGVGKGAAEVYGVQFTGWLGWLIRLGFFLYFQPSRQQALRILADWLTLAFLGRQMTIATEWQREPENTHELAR